MDQGETSGRGEGKEKKKRHRKDKPKKHKKHKKHKRHSSSSGKSLCNPLCSSPPAHNPAKAARLACMSYSTPLQLLGFNGAMRNSL